MKTPSYYQYLSSKLPLLISSLPGMTHLWLPPPSQSVDHRGYLPGQLYNLNSRYGTRDELVALLQALKAANVAPMADIVINHRCADGKDENGIYNVFNDDVTHQGRVIDWGRWAITCDDPTFRGSGNRDTGADYLGAPDLDHANPELRAALKDWLRFLIHEIGFESWRLDFAKGYAGWVTKEYLEASLGGEWNVAVGEYWTDLKWHPGGDLGRNQDAARQQAIDWIKSTSNMATAFDFVTKGILQEALKRQQLDRLRGQDGKPPGLMGWWPSRAVTFIDNHDTGSTQKHWPFDPKWVEAGYAYILSHPGVPCLFIEHVLEWGDALRAKLSTLLEMRRRVGVRADSQMTIKCAEPDMYVAEMVGTRGHVICKLGSRYDMGRHYPSKEEGWHMTASGEGYALFEKLLQV